jgi:hypothetical protein
MGSIIVVSVSMLKRGIRTNATYPDDAIISVT